MDLHTIIIEMIATSLECHIMLPVNYEKFLHKTNRFRSTFNVSIYMY